MKLTNCIHTNNAIKLIMCIVSCTVRRSHDKATKIFEKCLALLLLAKVLLVITGKFLAPSISSNISKTSASVSSGFQTREKLMKARGRRPSAFIVFECLKPR